VRTHACMPAHERRRRPLCVFWTVCVSCRCCFQPCQSPKRESTAQLAHRQLAGCCCLCLGASAAFPAFFGVRLRRGFVCWDHAAAGHGFEPRAIHFAFDLQSFGLFAHQDLAAWQSTQDLSFVFDWYALCSYAARAVLQQVLCWGLVLSCKLYCCVCQLKIKKRTHSREVGQRAAIRMP
jgi:hypothetical protein